MKFGNKFLILLIILALMLGTYVGTTLANPHECDCDGKCAATDDCCGCSTGSHKVYCDKCESDEECVYGETLIDDDGYEYPAFCQEC